MAALPARWHGGPMLSSRTSRLCLVTVLGVLAAAASTAPAASAAAQRYAGPTGSVGDCSSASPCDIKQAVTGAAAGDEVIVSPGDYPLTTTLGTQAPITIHGVAGQPRPRLLFSGPGQQGLQVTSGSTLRYVEVDQERDDATALFAVESSVEQVIAKAAGAQATAEISNSTISNSIVVASGTNGVALRTLSMGGTSLGTYRSVTAIATDVGGVAIQAVANDLFGYAGILARNVIARGGPGGHSLEALSASSGATAKLTVDHSNWLGASTQGDKALIVDAAGNQTAAPAFVNAAAGDYHQAAGSPTIDAGLDEAINGPFDVDGDPRQIGGIDIGADEFVVAPAATTGPASAVTDRSATLSGSVSANSVPTSYWFEYGPTTAYGGTTPATDAGSGGAVAATATLGGLSPATTYHYRLVAANSGVTTKGADQTFSTTTTTATSSTGTSSTATSSTPTSTSATAPPTPPFAGVRLMSTRLSFDGRFIALKLSCPAGTVGHCSARTKLTARRRAGSGAASSVTLGRASVSIAAGKQAKVRVRVSRGGRRLLGRVRPLRGKDTNAAHDGAGRSKTTVAAVTIRRR
jgi:hypothetical protein